MNDFRKILWLIVGCMLAPAFMIAQNCGVDSLIEWPFAKRISFEGRSVEKQDRILFKQDEVQFYEASNSVEVVIRKHIVQQLGSENQLGALVSLPFYASDSLEQIVDIRAVTHNKDGSLRFLDPEQISLIDLNSRYKSYEFLMPEADSGDVIEYAYGLRRAFIEELPDFYFQESVPVEMAQFILRYPDYIRYSVKPQNASGIHICNWEISKDTSDVPPIFIYRRPPPQVSEVWMARDLPPLPEQELAGNTEELKAKLISTMSEFGRPRQPLEISWEVTLARYRKEQRVFNRLEKWKSLLPDSLFEAWRTLPEIQRIQQIFSHVNEPVRIALPFSSVAKEPDKIVDQPIDQWNQADQNLRLVAWLQKLDIPAKLVLAPIESAGKIRAGYPSLFKLNAILGYVELDGKPIWLDASLPSSSPNLLRKENLSSEALIIESFSHQWIRTNTTESIFSLQANLNAELDNNGNLDGFIEAELRGYPARNIIEQQRRGEDAQAIVSQLFFDRYSLVYVDSASIRIEEGMQRKLFVQARFRLPEYTLSFSDALDFNPLVIGYRQQNPIDSNHKRVLPIQLDAPEYIQLNFDVRLPNSLVHGLNDFNQQAQIPMGFFTESYDFGPKRLQYRFEVGFSARTYDASLAGRISEIYQRWVDLSNTRWKLNK